MSLGYLNQIYTDDETKTVEQEIKEGFQDIIECEKKIQQLEEQMHKYPDDLNIITDYSDMLEHFNNI